MFIIITPINIKTVANTLETVTDSLNIKIAKTKWLDDDDDKE